MSQPEAPVIMLQTVEVELKAQRGSNQRRNIIHYRYANSGPTPGQLNQLLSEVEAQVIGAYEDFVCLGTNWYELVARDMQSPTAITASRQINRIGAGGTQVAPSNVTLCLTKRTAQRGRSYRGRFYLIDLPEDFFNGDDVNPLFLPAITSLATALQTTMVGTYFLPAVGSRTLQGSTPIQAITFDLTADSQRRRLQGRGV